MMYGEDFMDFHSAKVFEKVTVSSEDTFMD